MLAVSYPHLTSRTDGAPIISGTTTKVVEVAMDHVAYGWDAEQIHRQYPYLNLGQIHSALAYYYDHQAEMDRQIAEQWQDDERLIEASGPSPVIAKLKAKVVLP